MTSFRDVPLQFVGAVFGCWVAACLGTVFGGLMVVSHAHRRTTTSARTHTHTHTPIHTQSHTRTPGRAQTHTNRSTHVQMQASTQTLARAHIRNHTPAPLTRKVVVPMILSPTLVAHFCETDGSGHTVQSGACGESAAFCGDFRAVRQQGLERACARRSGAACGAGVPEGGRAGERTTASRGEAALEAKRAGAARVPQGPERTGAGVVFAGWSHLEAGGAQLRAPAWCAGGAGGRRAFRGRVRETADVGGGGCARRRGRVVASK